MTDQTEQLPFMVVVKLHEGYVLNVQGYGIAITNAADLARRVGEVAAQSEVGFQAPAEHDISDTLVEVPVGRGEPIADPLAPASPTETAATLQAVPDGVVPTANLEQEWGNVRKLIAFMATGFDSKGRAFTRKEWDAGLEMFAPHVDPKEAEFELGEFLSEMHPDD